MTQVETIAEAIRSFDWAKYGIIQTVAPGSEGADFVEPLAAHIRERMQGSRWQPLDPRGTAAPTGVAEPFISTRTAGPDLGDDPDGDIEGYDGR